MSTPTTATATLPPYAAGYPFAHQSSYRSTLPGAGSSRLGASSVSSPSSSYAPYSPTVSVAASTVQQQHAASTMNSGTAASSGHARYHHNNNSVHANHHATGQLDGAASPSYTPKQSKVALAAALAGTSSSSATETVRQAVMASSSQSNSGSQPPRKRRRSGPPDWDTFYKNGLPQEVIVIEDTPDRDDPGHRGQNGHSKVVSVAAPASVASASSSTLNSIYQYNHLQQPQEAAAVDRHLTKKRRRQDEPLTAATRYDPVHPSYPQSSGSTISSERTTNSNSHSSTAINTAATSLVSNGTYDYDAGMAGQKRKRTTRQQLANEAKRRDRDIAVLGPSFTHYRPPPLPPIKAPDVDVKVIHDAHYNKSVKVDDDDGHYIVIPDADLTERYQMVKLLGQGTFGKVVQARDRRKNELVAIKIIRSVQKYRDASRIELRVLETLKANDRENRNRCIHLRECFDFRGHICIVMSLLDQSVFDFLKGNGFVPFPNSQIQSFARQLFTSVAFLHDLQLIHTDLKPENILLVDANYQTFTYNRKIPSSSTTVARQATQRKVLLDTEIRLIDFGSATFQDEYHSSVVSTRHYRAPEIILGLGWSFPCDIWSIGCILVEFFTGDALFQTHDNLEHLAMMEAVCESRIDTHLVQQVAKSTRHGGNPAAKYFKRSRLDYPSSETTRASKRFVKAMKKLSDIIPSSNPFLKQFLDLLKRIFVYDPSQRITAKEALQHPWFREATLQDDGTEAAKIRHERARASRERAATRTAMLH